MPLTDKKRISNDRYIKSRDNITTRYRRGMRAEIQAAADSAGESMNAFITKAVEQRIAEEEDMDFCVAMVDRYHAINDPEKDEFIPIKEVAAELGITL